MLVAVCLAVCSSSGAPSAHDAAAKTTAIADAYVKGYFEAFPEQALQGGAPDIYPDRLTDHSLAALGRWQTREDQWLAELRAIDGTVLAGAPEAATYALLQNLLESAQVFRICRMELWNVSPTFTGWQSELSITAGMQATSTPEQQRQALARWAQLPAYLDAEIANLRTGVKLGYLAPKGNVRSVIAQVDAMLRAPVAESPFVQMAKGDAKPFRMALEELETAKIRPAIARYRDYLRDEYLPSAREAIGISANPRGAEGYRAAVMYHATVDLTAQGIHDLGLAQMKAIRAQMAEIGQRSFGTADPAQVLAVMRNDPKYRFKSRKELIQYAEAAVERARLALPRFFGRLPKAPVIVEPYPALLEKSAPGGQAILPTADGQPGKYLINARNATEQSRAGLESTAFHETYPGHHLQGTLALEREGLHAISRYFWLSGYGEGWALYAERLAEEMGLFSSDVDRLGMLSNEAMRAARLVVDPGMHVLGWSRQQAIDYLVAHTTETKAGAEAEIDRYIAAPGHATAYMIGSLEIWKLRTEAEQALGAKFDLRAFHDALLEDGGLPLWALRAKIDRWVAVRRPTTTQK
jgi:uncharacterized protein (DUF885 family)